MRCVLLAFLALAVSALPSVGYGRSDARTVASTYDNLNRLLRVYDNEDRGQDYHYDTNGNRVSLWEPNAGWVGTTYDALNRPKWIWNHAPGGNLSQYDYEVAYDQYNNVALQTETYPYGQIGNRTLTLGYDADNQLTSEQIVAGNTTTLTTYAYNAAHDRTNKLVTQTAGGNTTVLGNYTYMYGGPNLLGGISLQVPTGSAVYGVQFLYDGADNLIYAMDSSLGNPATGVGYVRMGSNSYAYDYENRLVGQGREDDRATTITHDPDIYRNEYAYDYRGRRVLNYQEADIAGTSRNFIRSTTLISEMFSGGVPIRDYTVNGNDTTYSWGNLAAWTPANTTLPPSVEYIRGSDMGGGVGGVIFSLHNDAPSLYHYDSRGDVIAQTDWNGNLTYQAGYLAFGQHNPVGNLNGSQPMFPGAWGAEEWTGANATTDNLRDNTKEENDLGLVNQGQRYTNLQTDMFLTRDPLGFADGTNPQIYVHQNPYGHFDPEGLSDSWPWQNTFWGWVTSPVHVVYDAVAVPVEEFNKLNENGNTQIQRGQDMQDKTAEQQLAAMTPRVQTVKDSLVPAATALTSVPGTSFTGPVSGPTTAATLASSVRPLEAGIAANVINKLAAVAEKTGITEATARGIYQEGQAILKSDAFATLQQAYKDGKYAEVVINGRKISYEPGIPTGIGYNAVTDTPNKGFTLGADAFSSQKNLTQTVFHEVTRLKTSEALQAGEVSGEAAKQETAQADAVAKELTNVATGN
jgi:RHS repeat-associated protein